VAGDWPPVKRRKKNTYRRGSRGDAEVTEVGQVWVCWAQEGGKRVAGNGNRVEDKDNVGERRAGPCKPPVDGQDTTL
jgi:hypothetical protein